MFLLTDFLIRSRKDFPEMHFHKEHCQAQPQLQSIPDWPEDRSPLTPKQHRELPEEHLPELG